MKIRRILLATIVVALGLQVVPFTAGAQLNKLKNTTPEQRATVQTLLMEEKLHLTPEQKPKIAAINLKYANRMQPLIQSSEGPLMEMRQIKEMNDAKEAELKQILTPAQFEAYLASKEEMRQKFEERIMQKAGQP